LDWNPHGHEPEQIYGAPHFDFHFYSISQAERAAIPAYEADPTKFDNGPGAAYLPPTYMNFGGGVPQMGAHWVDITSPELNQQNPKAYPAVPKAPRTVIMGEAAPAVALPRHAAA
jgi:hypothetical protein